MIEKVKILTENDSIPNDPNHLTIRIDTRTRLIDAEQQISELYKMQKIRDHHKVEMKVIKRQDMTYYKSVEDFKINARQRYDDLAVYMSEMKCYVRDDAFFKLYDKVLRKIVYSPEWTDVVAVEQNWNSFLQNKRDMSESWIFMETSNWNN